jgi:hypothetical protein
MLEEDEWRIVQEQLSSATAALASHHSGTGVIPGETSIRSIFQPALDAYERITGFRETNYNALSHHRVALYGPPCHNCGRPLRTPDARLCGSCMAPRERA